MSILNKIIYQQSSGIFGKLNCLELHIIIKDFCMVAQSLLNQTLQRSVEYFTIKARTFAESAFGVNFYIVTS